MRWAESFIAVDWGTTNRRAYLVEAGRNADEFEDGRGILSLHKDAFGGAVAEIRQRLGERPMLLAGMVGSNRGWVEAPYVQCPASLSDLAEALVRIDERTAIVPGVALSNGRCDVMRGEEVQLVGAVAAGQIPPDCVVCHPGTHNKWVRIVAGRIESFRTVMTGELFNLLKERSILSELLGAKSAPGAAFRQGVSEGLAGGGLAAQLFEARARFLLGRLSAADGASFVSGLLIGGDVRVGLAEARDSNIVAMGRPELTALYSEALAQCGVECVRIDGEGAFIAGARRIVEALE